LNKRHSEIISSRVAQAIVNSAPCIEYDTKMLDDARSLISSADIHSKEIFENDFEHYYVVDRFCDMLGLYKIADEEYLSKIFAESKKLSAKAFYHDPFINTVSVPDIKIGNFLLLNAFYEKGEIFQYDMPELDADIVVPKIGFFDAPVCFPSIYEGNIPWMSVCPSEINSMREQMAAAHGRVLVLGLGLGYYPFIVSRRDDVSEITIIERQPEIIRIFEDYILPHFPHKNKIKVVEADAFDYLAGVSDGEFDFCFADIWEGQQDGAEAYVKIKKFDEALSHTEFTYWIEKEIKWYLENK
jgi:hypothetical protein